MFIFRTYIILFLFVVTRLDAAELMTVVREENVEKYLSSNSSRNSTKNVKSVKEAPHVNNVKSVKAVKEAPKVKKVPAVISKGLLIKI